MKHDFEESLNLDKSNEWEYQFYQGYFPVAKKIFNELCKKSNSGSSFQTLLNKDAKQITSFILEIAMLMPTYSYGSRLDERKLSLELKSVLEGEVRSLKKKTSFFRKQSNFQNVVYTRIKNELDSVLVTLSEIQNELNNSVNAIESHIKSDFDKSKKRKLNTKEKIKTDFIFAAVLASRKVYNRPNINLIEELFEIPYLINKFGETSSDSIKQIIKRQNRDSKY